MPKKPAQKAFFVVSLDLVEYTKNTEPDQVNLFRRFHRQIHHLLYDEISDNECILIPTGDGMIVGIEDGPTDSRVYLRPLELVTGMLRWTEEQGCQIRASIHVGATNVLRDINQRQNLVGTTINDATRILGGADKGAIVISKDYVDKYLDADSPTPGSNISVDDRFTIVLVDEDVVVDKHDKEHMVYSIVLVDHESREYGSRASIAGRYAATIYADEYPKKQNLKEQFFNRVANCKQLILLGLYHPNTPDILEQIPDPVTDTVEVQVHCAADSLESQLQDFFQSNETSLTAEVKRNSIEAIRSWHARHSSRRRIHLKLFEYAEFVPFGASLVDAQHSGKGFLHVSHYLPRVLPSSTPYVETTWRTNSPPPLYKFYVDYLFELLDHHKRID